MITAIIVDDEQHCRASLEHLIAAFFPEICIKATCKSPIEGIAAIHKHQPTLVFLDVEMPPYTGFDMLQQLNEINFEIILLLLLRSMLSMLLNSVHWTTC